MTIRPIIFSGPMVRALLEGRKTQTRRLLKPVPPEDWEPAPELVELHRCENGYPVEPRTKRDILGMGWVESDGLRGIRAPYLPGDQLYVRGAWSGDHGVASFKPSERPEFLQGPVWYWADGDPSHGDWERPRPSIHMPRWASRLTLTVTDVRAQQLQEISEDDARAEGCNGFNSPAGHADDASPREEFQDLWNSLHGDGAWDANPWLVAISFEVHHRNVDQMREAA